MSKEEFIEKMNEMHDCVCWIYVVIEEGSTALFASKSKEALKVEIKYILEMGYVWPEGYETKKEWDAAYANNTLEYWIKRSNLSLHKVPLDEVLLVAHDCNRLIVNTSVPSMYAYGTTGEMREQPHTRLAG